LLASRKKIDRIRTKRKKRVRGKISGSAARPRLAVFRSARHIYVQAIDDTSGKTLADASTMSTEIRESLGVSKKIEAAKQVGKLVARRLLDKGIAEAVFDRGRFLYHGRVKALAEAARESGLKF
jgi:large subunit ribosomal protein L18